MFPWINYKVSEYSRGLFKMNINQMKYVLMVASCSSMREAATKLYISQPALSSSIRELEEELQILIFDRNNKGVVVTEAGREFITYAKKAVGQFELVEDRYSLKNKDKELFSVSSQHFNFPIKAFTKLVRQYDMDKYLFSIHETKTNIVLHHVRDMVSEVGIISYSSSNEIIIKKLIKEYNLEFVPLMQRETYAYFWKNHKFAKRKNISLTELQDYPCVSFDQSDSDSFYLVEEALSDFDFKKSIVSDDRATSMEIIAELDGYSIGSGMLSGDEQILPGLVSVKLKEEDPLTIGYIIRKNSTLSKYGKQYIEELLKYKEL